MPRSASWSTALRPRPRPPPVTSATRDGDEVFAMHALYGWPCRGGSAQSRPLGTRRCYRHHLVTMAIIKQLPVVPAERTLRIIGGRWKVYVLYYLFEQPRRMSELRRLISTASQKVLVDAVRELEDYGIVR